MDTHAFDGLDSLFKLLFLAAGVGLLALLAWAGVTVWWVWHHLSIAVR